MSTMDAAQLFRNGDESIFASHIGWSSANAIIAVIDNDHSSRKSLVRLIRAAGYEPEAFASATDFLESLVLQVASCVISELSMPGLNGLQLQQSLQSKMPSLSMIFVSAHADVAGAVTAIKAGAIDLFEKPVRRGALLEAIGCAVRRTNKWRAAMAEIAKLNIQYGRLTPREREVFALLSAGLLNKQVAAQLGAAEKTVKQHRGTIMRKMEAESFADLVLMAERIGVRPRHANFAEAKGRLSPRYVDSQSLQPSVASCYRSVGAQYDRHSSRSEHYVS
jgi:FixJ family two-component response regulator